MTARGCNERFVARTPAGARRFVRCTLVDWERDDLVDDAELLVSELVTNVLMHTPADHASLQVTTDDDGAVRVEVCDPSSAATIRALEPDPEREGGRGLGIVASLSTRWGVERADRSKCVWFELAYAR